MIKGEQELCQVGEPRVCSQLPLVFSVVMVRCGPAFIVNDKG